MLVIDIFADRIRQFLTWNVGHNIEIVIFRILRSIDAPFIDCPVHIVSFQAADDKLVIMPASHLLLLGSDFIISILAFEFTFVQYIDYI